MPKYLLHGSYGSEGAKGLIKQGGSKRRATVEKVAAAVGGRIESFYYAFGDSDFFVVADLPDHASAAAISLAVNASGAVNLKTTVLLSPEEMDAATKKGVGYRPPGK